MLLLQMLSLKQQRVSLHNDWLLQIQSKLFKDLCDVGGQADIRMELQIWSADHSIIDASCEIHWQISAEALSPIKLLWF